MNVDKWSILQFSVGGNDKLNTEGKQIHIFSTIAISKNVYESVLLKMNQN